MTWQFDWCKLHRRDAINQSIHLQVYDLQDLAFAFLPCTRMLRAASARKEPKSQKYSKCRNDVNCQNIELLCFNQNLYNRWRKNEWNGDFHFPLNKLRIWHIWESGCYWFRGQCIKITKIRTYRKIFKKGWEEKAYWSAAASRRDTWFAQSKMKW